jgi:hypothetical protein
VVRVWARRPDETRATVTCFSMLDLPSELRIFDVCSSFASRKRGFGLYT